METKLYVGNLSYATTEDELRTLFAQAGTVESEHLIKDRSTGSSKGFGFIVMSNQSELEKAIQMFNSYSLRDRELTVNIARPRRSAAREGTAATAMVTPSTARVAVRGDINLRLIIKPEGPQSD